jgi:Domain of unknown function (DUF4337)
MDTLPTIPDDQLAVPARDNSRLNMTVAITVALLSTVMGVCKVKDDNIVQAMQQAQANKLDHWAFYQARNIREEVARATLVQLKIQAADAHDPERFKPAIVSYEQLLVEQEKKKLELKEQSEKDQKDYDAANFRDDQFDLSDAFLALAVALLAVTALTGQRWLYGAAMVPTLFGVVMGLAGLCGWGIHPSWLTSLLS